MGLWITDSGARTVEIAGGVRAAEAEFKRIGWDPAEVNRLMREDGDSWAHKLARQLWSSAELAAFRVAFVGWDKWPESACLVWEGCATLESQRNQARAQAEEVGRRLYEADLAERPHYHTGEARPSWDRLGQWARSTWR